MDAAPEAGETGGGSGPPSKKKYVTIPPEEQADGAGASAEGPVLDAAPGWNRRTSQPGQRATRKREAGISRDRTLSLAGAALIGRARPRTRRGG